MMFAPFAAVVLGVATNEPILVVTDTAQLDAIESAAHVKNAAFAFDAATPEKPVTDNFALAAASATYRDLVRVVDGDVREIYANDKSYGVGMRYAHRGFDVKWLNSPSTRWELAGVVNRIDRKVFDAGTCGEVRLVYRLAYTTPQLSSRLPATLNVVFYLPDDAAGCRAVAAGFAKPLVDEVLSERRLDLARLKSIEIDLQTARWPSTVRPDLGGHAEYLLRVFHRVVDEKDKAHAAHLVAAPLENTPDVDRIAKDASLRTDLVAFLAAHADEIDRGVVVVPDKFLATRAISATPHGLARAQNRPWTRALASTDLAPIVAHASPSGAPSTIATKAALLRRLDGLTCMGCHQSRSLAGFHLLGADRANNGEDAAGALASPISPHLVEDLPRRRAYLSALLAGAPVDDRRRPPEHELDRGGFGDSCGLVDAHGAAVDAAFSSWACAPGFSCTAVDDATVGECLPNAPLAGSACLTGVVDFAHDRIAKKEMHNLGCTSGAVCEGVDVGFPGGMCASTCEAPGDHATCGAIAQLTPFNDCLAKGGLFTTCAKLATAAGLRACSVDDPCRPDYICASSPSSPSSSSGVCLPPYFVLQMRVDGHRVR
jgi:hypothetical protein